MENNIKKRSKERDATFLCLGNVFCSKCGTNLGVFKYNKPYSCDNCFKFNPDGKNELIISLYKYNSGGPIAIEDVFSPENIESKK